ncbi:MAG: MaoC family dehydratase [Cephaloticoccus sp.]|nr:MaoC family dehydratase [Cephaloticoccus sp.]MCF7760310.1 MaoC family dehydratase [Cephaloticoccus sp.]
MIYFEDLEVGSTYHSPEHEMTPEEIVTFARQYDPQDFHTDAEAAKATLFGHLVASGWHTAAVTMGLMVRSNLELDGGVIGQGVESLRWPRPVLPGDRLRVVMEIIEIGTERTRTGRGRAKLRCRTFNQNDKVVQEMIANLVIACRRAG